MGTVVVGKILAVYCASGSYFHLYDGLQGLGFAWILVQLISSVQFLLEKMHYYVAQLQQNLVLTQQKARLYD